MGSEVLNEFCHKAIAVNVGQAKSAERVRQSDGKLTFSLKIASHYFFGLPNV